MSKKIITALLMVLLVVSSALTAFAVIDEEKPALEVVSADFDEKTGKATMTIKNVGEESFANSALVFVYDNEAIEIENYQMGIQVGEMASGAEQKIVFNVKKLKPDAAVEIGFMFQYIFEGDGAIDLSLTQKDIMADVKSVTVNNIFADKESASAFDAIMNFLDDTGFSLLIKDPNALIMIAVACVLLYLAIVKKFEPLLLLPIAFGMLLTNLPGANLYHSELYAGGHVDWANFVNKAGLIDYLYLGVKLGIYPSLIFIGVGAMTDFGPLIANPKSLLLGAAAQLGIFVTFIAAKELLAFSANQAGSIGIIGGADGPTAIFVTSKLAPELLGPIAVAAYSYMALVPVIQPPIMKALTTKKERQIEMKQLREVSRTEKIIFPIVVTVFVSLLLPSAAPLIGALMLGNLMKESGVVERISKTVQNELMNIVTIFLGISVGATATVGAFFNWQTLGILLLGVIAFSFGSAGGVLLAKIMNLFSKEKINPLIGSAGVSAVPMAARVSQMVGQKENPGNFLLMHAMGPNVAGVIGSAIAAGVFLSLFA